MTRPETQSRSTTLSIGNAKLTMARLPVPGTDLTAATIVGEMELPCAPGKPSRRLVAIGTALEHDGSEIESSARVRYVVVSDPLPTRTELAKRHPIHSSRRRHR